MKRKTDHKRSFYPNAGKRMPGLSLVPRWRIALAALAAVLIFGSMSQILPAQAARFRTDAAKIGFELKPYPEGPLTVCKNESVSFEVIVSKTEQVALPGGVRPVHSILSGVAVNGAVGDTSLGTLSPPANWTDFQDGDYLSASFTFHAKQKAGATVITFSSKIKWFWVGDGAKELNSKQIAVPDKKVQVKVVENCGYTITISSHFKIPQLEYVGSILEAELTPDENGIYTGTAPIVWRARWQVIPAGIDAGIDCLTTITAPPQQANLTGRVDDKGNLVLEITYQAGNGTWRAICSDSTGSIPPVDNPVNLSLSPLTVSVSASRGGGGVKPQELVDQTAGSVTYNIHPKKS